MSFIELEVACIYLLEVGSQKSSRSFLAIIIFVPARSLPFVGRYVVHDRNLLDLFQTFSDEDTDAVKTHRR